MDSLTHPTKEILEYENRNKYRGSSNSSKRESNNNRGINQKGKSNHAFSLFGFGKGHKGCEVRDKEDKEKHKKKHRFDVVHALKKYLGKVQPPMLSRGRREKIQLHGEAYSYSGNVAPRNKKESRGWRGEYSAPASMWTRSQTNRGSPLASTGLPRVSDSTTEEFQATIQAAVAYCKNSIAKEENLKS